MWSAVDRRRAEHRATVLLVTHNVIEAETVLDRVAVLDRGRVIACDTPSGLKEKVAGEVRVDLVWRESAPLNVPEVAALRDRVVESGRRWTLRLAPEEARAVVATVTGGAAFAALDDFTLATPSLERVPGAGWRRATGAGEGVSTRAVRTPAAASVPVGATVPAGATASNDPSEGELRDVSVVPADALRGAAPAAEGRRVAGPAELGPRARLWPSLVAVYRAQLSRARVARIPLLFVATFQSVGIMILMRGVVDGGGEARAVVAGSAVLVVAFVALNLLAQYFGQLRASGGLDHYATLPVPPAAVVLGAAGAYASFTVPGTVVTAVFGCLLFGLPMTHLWVLVAVIPLAGAALAGLGAALGLLAPRPEFATLLGQLGMSAALLLGVLPPERMPQVVRLARDLLPSTYGVEAFARTFGERPDWGFVLGDLAVCAAVGVISLAVATWAYRRAAVR
ncbi:hypothetical protein STENM36S_07767 [Streptomyces tendae]